MSEITDKFETYLKAKGYSLTKQRLLVFKVLLENESISMKDLVGQTSSKVDRVSVYRTVALFEKLGITQRVNIGWKYKLELSDIFKDHHHHLVCVNCGHVVPINETSMETFIDKIAGQHGFRPLKHEIEVQGLCPKCQKSRSLA